MAVILIVRCTRLPSATNTPSPSILFLLFCFFFVLSLLFSSLSIFVSPFTSFCRSIFLLVYACGHLAPNLCTYAPTLQIARIRSCRQCDCSSHPPTTRLRCSAFRYRPGSGFRIVRENFASIAAICVPLCIPRVLGTGCFRSAPA